MLDQLLNFGIAYAQAEGGKQPSTFEALILPMVVFLAIMYFLMIRPQTKKQKEHETLMAGLKSGDEIITSGGIIGKVASVAEGFVTIDVSGNTSLKILKSHVSGLSKPKDQKKK